MVTEQPPKSPKSSGVAVVVVTTAGDDAAASGAAVVVVAAVVTVVAAVDVGVVVGVVVVFVAAGVSAGVAVVVVVATVFVFVNSTASTNSFTFSVSNSPYSCGSPILLNAALCMSGDGDFPTGLPSSQNLFLGMNMKRRCCMMEGADIWPGAASGRPSKHT